jgi:hypothetical protein
MRTIRASLFALTILMLGSCSTKNTQSNEQPFRHSVRFEGENLSIISEWYTGNKSNLSAIVQDNKNIDPAKIELGAVIIIPKSLLINRAPMTEEFVRLKAQPILPPVTTSSDLVAQQKRIESSQSNRDLQPTKRTKKDTEELIKTREDLWQELIGE